MLTIADVVFEENTKIRDTAFFFHKNKGQYEIGLDITYLSNVFEDEECSPCLNISPFETEAKELSELVGKSFCVADIETADEREDTFCLFEHEPLVQYSFTILAVENKTIHIECFGTAVTDGYAEPYATAHFELDCWLPIISCVKDWKRLGL